MLSKQFEIFTHVVGTHEANVRKKVRADFENF